jgi:acetyl-CoA synthetase
MQNNEIPKEIKEIIDKYPAETAWHLISTNLLTTQEPFDLHLAIFKHIFPQWPAQPYTAPAWIPDPVTLGETNLQRLMDELNLHHREEFHRWSVLHFEKFWELMSHKLGIIYHQPYQQICDLSKGIEQPNWLAGAKLNIAQTCFKAPPERIALLYQDENHTSIQRITYGELNQLSNRVANSLIKLNLKPGDAIAIDMPMTIEAVGIYLGIIKMGGAVVSIADSFSPEEIATRLKISQAKAIFTQDYLLRNGKQLPLYQKIIDANAPQAIVISTDNKSISLRKIDFAWQQFLVNDDSAAIYFADPMNTINILFSSGTTAEPKAIPWNHTTAIKVVSDAYLHQNIQPEDILAWPTNLGWMMGPWLVFAALINQATIAIYNGSPLTQSFGKFIQETKVTMLGVVPTLVAHWRQNNCMQNLDWHTIKAFSSTGESSNPEDMLYLMYLAGYKPIIEYCGGTEIGGAYITSTLIEKNFPSLFSTPAMGIDLLILDEQGQSVNNGEVALIPPSMGLSTQLLNADHHQVYYAGMPKSPDGKILRRHGDQLKQYPTGLYSALGRVDDTMNLGGIKISSSEIERTLTGIDSITECAAIAVSPTQGPSLLVIYAATEKVLDKEKIKQHMQQRINQSLNPLFRIHDVVFVKELPKTSSNKIMRRLLRKFYR